MKTKMNVDAKELSKALAVFDKMISPKAALPVLRDVLLTYDKAQGIFRLIGSDTESWLMIDCTNERKEGDEVKTVAYANMLEDDQRDSFTAVCLPFRDLKDAVGALPTGYLLQVSFDGESHTMTVDYQIGTFTMPFHDAIDYPLPVSVVTKEGVQSGDQGSSTVYPVCRFSIEASELLPLMKQARICVGNDDLRPALNCEAMDISQEKLVLVASDGHSMYRKVMEKGAGWLEYGEFPADGSRVLMIPKPMLGAVTSAFEKSGRLTITADTQRVEWKADGIVLICRMPEGRFPNYNAVIPQTSDYTLAFCTADMRAALRRLSLFASSASNLGILERKGGQLQIEASDYDFSKSGSERISLVNADTCTLQEGVRFGFKIATMAGLLDVVGDDNTLLLVTNPSKAMVIKPEDVAKQNLTLMQMPMLVNE